MEPQKEHQPKPKSHILTRTWQEFTDKAIDLLMQNPVQGKVTLKFAPKTQKFVVKATDGSNMFIHKCKSEEYEQVMKFAFMAGKVFTNEGNRKQQPEVKQKQEKKPKKQKKKK